MSWKNKYTTPMPGDKIRIVRTYIDLVNNKHEIGDILTLKNKTTFSEPHWGELWDTEEGYEMFEKEFEVVR